MTRVKRARARRRKIKTTFRLVDGFRGKTRSYRIANQRKMKAYTSAYTGRKRGKREFRRLWIVRLNAALSNHRYSAYHSWTQKQAVRLNRKCLSQMAVWDQTGFDAYTSALHP